MTFVQAAFLVPAVVCALSILWLLRYVLRTTRQAQLNEVQGLENLDDLRWNGWNRSMGWPPVTCWNGCSYLHRDDWWRVYLDRTCWAGCQDLHREDWWRAYVEQPEQPPQKVQ
jgi:hypothetical protein